MMEEIQKFSGEGGFCLWQCFVALEWVEFIYVCIAPSDEAYELLLSLRACWENEVHGYTSILYFMEIKTILGPACRPIPISEPIFFHLTDVSLSHSYHFHMQRDFVGYLWSPLVYI